MLAGFNTEFLTGQPCTRCDAEVAFGEEVASSLATMSAQVKSLTKLKIRQAIFDGEQMEQQRPQGYLGLLEDTSN